MKLQNRYVMIGLASIAVFTAFRADFISNKSSVNEGDISANIGDTVVTDGDTNVIGVKNSDTNVTLVSPMLAPVTLSDQTNKQDKANITGEKTISGESVTVPTAKVSPTPSVAQVTQTPTSKPTLSPSVSPMVTPSPTAQPTQTPAPTETEKNFSSLDVVMNEIGWMGTEADASDEWLELYNNTEQTIDLSGWQILSKTDNGPNIIISSGKCSNTFIQTGGYFLIERTADSTISNVVADCAVSFGKNGSIDNTAEHLALLDPSGNIIDEINFIGQWPGGTNSPKASMERISPGLPGSEAGNWKTGIDGSIAIDAENLPVLGTPRSQNSAN